MPNANWEKSKEIKQWLRAFWDERAWEKSEDCILWPFAKLKTGYGVTSKTNGTLYIHRIVFMQFAGKMQNSQIQACHACDVPACINPMHLFWGTNTDNVRDAARKGRNVVPTNAKVSEDQAAQIREFVAAGELSHSAIGEMFGVKRKAVSNIATRKSFKTAPGEITPSRTKISEEQIHAIRVLLADGKLSQKAIGDLFGLSQSMVSMIHKNQRWGRVN